LAGLGNMVLLGGCRGIFPEEIEGEAIFQKIGLNAWKFLLKPQNCVDFTCFPPRILSLVLNHSSANRLSLV